MPVVFGVENICRGTLLELMITKCNCCPKYTNIIVSDDVDISDQRLEELIHQVDINAKDNKKATKAIKVHISTDDDVLKYRGVAQSGILNFTKNCLAMLMPDEKNVEDKNLRKAESLEKFKYACWRSKINFEELQSKWVDGYITEGEQKKIFKNVEYLQKHSSKAATLWQKFASFEIYAQIDLKQLLSLKQLTQEEFDLFTPLVGKSYKNNSCFNELATDDKELFLKLASKTKKVADEKFTSWFLVKPRLRKATTAGLASALMRSETTTSRKDSGAGAFSMEDHKIKLPRRKDTDDLPLIEIELTPEEKYQKAKKYIDQLADGRNTKLDLQAGYKKLEVICQMLELKIDVIKTQKKENKTLIEEITKFKEFSSSIFFLFSSLKAIEKIINEEEKMQELKKILKDELYRILLLRTKGKRKLFFEKIKEAKELTNLDLEEIIILYAIAKKINPNDLKIHKSSYSNKHWFEGIKLSEEK